jgi:hypothetical protein
VAGEAKSAAELGECADDDKELKSSTGSWDSRYSIEEGKFLEQARRSMCGWLCGKQTRMSAASELD